VGAGTTDLPDRIDRWVLVGLNCVHLGCRFVLLVLLAVTVFRIVRDGPNDSVELLARLLGL